MDTLSPKVIQNISQVQPNIHFYPVPGGVKGLETVLQPALMYGQRGYRLFTGSVHMLWLAGRPVLFLVALCIGAAGAFAAVDDITSIVFLIAGCSAALSFLFFARNDLRRLEAEMFQSFRSCQYDVEAGFQQHSAITKGLGATNDKENEK